MWELAFRQLSPPILLISSHQPKFNRVTAPESSPCSQKEGTGMSTVCWHRPLPLWPPHLRALPASAPLTWDICTLESRRYLCASDRISRTSAIGKLGQCSCFIVASLKSSFAPKEAANGALLSSQGQGHGNLDSRAGGASQHVTKMQENKTKPLGSAAWLLDAPNW